MRLGSCGVTLTKSGAESTVGGEKNQHASGCEARDQGTYDSVAPVNVDAAGTGPGDRAR